MEDPIRAAARHEVRLRTVCCCCVTLLGMRVLIENYRNLTAGHCGSGSMRNLLFHYTGLELDEAVVFGLGAGLDAVYFSYPDAQPSYMFFGRGSSFETDLAKNLGIDYREVLEPDNNLAWQAVRDEIIAGRPTMLSGDIFYLDYRKFKVHFPAHRFVLLGFDEERDEVYIADRTDEATQTCSMQALQLSRNPPSAISTCNQWGKFHSNKIRNELPDACGMALRTTVERMLNIDKSQLAPFAAMQGNHEGELAVGLNGLRALIDQLPLWAELPDSQAHTRYLDNAIVKFGTGGGFFRDHFVGFMHWANVQRPDLVGGTTVKLAEDSARAWNALSPLLQEIPGKPGNTLLWKQARDALLDIHEYEYSLFSHLADTVWKTA